jgi:hypothetical protein
MLIAGLCAIHDNAENWKGLISNLIGIGALESMTVILYKLIFG